MRIHFAWELIKWSGSQPFGTRRQGVVVAFRADVIGNLPLVPRLPPKAFDAAVQRGTSVLVNTRSMLAFGGGHIEGAFNIAGHPELSCVGSSHQTSSGCHRPGGLNAGGKAGHPGSPPATVVFSRCPFQRQSFRQKTELRRNHRCNRVLADVKALDVP